MEAITYGFNDDLTLAQIDFEPRQVVDTKQIADLIRKLWIIRSQMAPAVADNPPLNEGVEGVHVGQHWWCGPDVMNAGALLLLRHPGLGWMAWSFSTEHAIRTAEALREYSGPVAPPLQAN